MNLAAGFLRRSAGAKLVIGSVALGLIGYLPLQLGPEDGNPIGLGLLALAAVPLAAIGVAVGAVALAIEAVRARPR